MIKYGNTKTNFAKSTRRVKRINRRLPKSIRPSGVNMRVEYTDSLYIMNNDRQALFATTAQSYLNFAAVLAANPAFVSQATNFMKYKITGVSLSVTPCWTETSMNAAFTNGIPVIFAQQYPIANTSSIGDEVIYSDNNMMIKPMSLTQTKFWSYKNNFLIGSGNGVGVWNQTNAISLQQGQISVRTPNNFGSGNTSGGNVTLYFIRIALYVTLDGKSR